MMLNPEQHDALLHAAVHSRRGDIAVLKASGPRIRDYLQGQITQDIRQLTATRAIYATVLTPQGKAVSDLVIAQGDNDELILLAWRSHAESLVDRLRRFSIGHTIRIGIVGDMGVHSIQGAHAGEILASAGLPDPGTVPLHAAYSENGILVLAMPEAAPQGYWLVAQNPTLDALHPSAEQAVDESVIRCARLRQGHPVFGIDWDETVHPLNANLHEYNGVSFDKGCYVGQEVTSRMHWRGGIKHHLYRFMLSALPDTLPTAIHTTAAIGTVTSAMQDSDGSVYAIGRLPISVAESGTQLHTDSGIAIEIIGACHG